MTTFEDFFRRAIEARQSGDQATAWNLLRAAISANPQDARPYFHLGLILSEAKKYAASAACFRIALRVNEDQPETLVNLGWNLHLRNRDDEALPLLERGLAVAGHWPAAWTNYSQVLLALSRHQDAVTAGRKAVELQMAGDSDPLPSMALGLAHLYAGEWQEGFKWYEARIRYRFPEWTKYPYPMWRGQKVDTLFVQAEQGLGDEIMCLRWITQAASRVTRLKLFCHRELRRLVETQEWLPGNVEVSAIPAPVPEADAWCPAFSLPIALGTDPLWQGPYLTAQRSSQQLDPGILNVGIVWGGDARQENDWVRSVEVTRFLALAEIEGVRLHSLQVGDRAKDLETYGLHGLIQDRMPELQDMADTAAVVSGLDLVISVCTSVMHLASSMGVPCFALVPRRGAFWIYQARKLPLVMPSRAGEDLPAYYDHTPWYPDTKIFRQRADRDWDEVFGRVTEAVREMAERKSIK